jgi:hypothetical protein
VGASGAGTAVGRQAYVVRTSAVGSPEASHATEALAASAGKQTGDVEGKRFFVGVSNR